MARFFLVLHALLSMAVAGAVSHLALVTIGFLRGSNQKVRLARIYAVSSAVLFGITLLVGTFAYPAYRYQVAGLFFSRHAPWAANLFDLKEAAGTLGLPLSLGLLLVGRKFEPKDRGVLAVYALCALGLFAVVAFCIISGLVIVAERGV